MFTPPDNCWTSQFSRDTLPEIFYENIYDLRDKLRSHRVIDECTFSNISERMISRPWTKDDADWLVYKELPRSGDDRYLTFCCLLRSMPDFSEIGEKLCDDCNASFTCINSTKVLLTYDSSCKEFLNSKGDTSGSRIYATLRYKVDYVEEMETKNSSVHVVYPSSIVCHNNTIAVWLKIGIPDKYIMEEDFRNKVAEHLRVNITEVRIIYIRTGCTLILLHLSFPAGLRLLQIFSEEESSYVFGEIIKGTLNCNSSSNVSIRAKISDMPPYTIHVIPTGVFSVKTERSDVPFIIDGTLFCLHQI